MNTSLAIIADVHGNALALEAVLADIARRGVRDIVNLGDNANGPLDPARAVSLLRSASAQHVRGNGDRMTADGGAGASGSARFARERLSAEALAWLAALPMTLSGDGWLACHGSPTNDTDYLLENVTPGGVTLRRAREIAARVGATEANLLLCGHTHVPRLVRLGDGRLVVNPGSVGLPAYEDAAPFPHRMENGSPHARYALANREDVRASWRIDFIAVDYAWDEAAAQAEASGAIDWARAVRTGYA